MLTKNDKQSPTFSQSGGCLGLELTPVKSYLWLLIRSPRRIYPITGREDL